MNTKYRYTGMVLVFVLAAFALPCPVRADGPGTARLSVVQGDVQVLIQDTSDWTPATVNLPLNEHDRLWTPDGSRAEIQIQGGVFARTDADTSLDILTINRDTAQFYLDRGHLYINNRQGGIGTVQVDTPTASFRSYDNSIVLVDVSEDGVNEVSVLQGLVYAESRAGATRVSAGSTLTLRGENEAEVSPINAPDEWEEWNADRDREVTAWTESSRYLPAELREFSSDFDQYGRWDYTTDYGYVWFPSVIAADWAPYSHGSWLWIRGTYVWIDYDPWGWAPMHYGRWVFIGTRGWCWVPPARGAVYWGPGYVGWVVTSSYVAWVPLAPGEVYYGHGYYGPGSVNITTININTLPANRTYRNSRERNSVIVVERDTFGTGKRVPARVRENPFESGGRNVTIVPPRAKPDRPVVVAPPGAREYTDKVMRERRERYASPMTRELPGRGEQARKDERHGAPRPAPEVQPRTAQPPPAVRPQQQLPPERVRKNRPEVTRNERPVVRQRESSVFRSQPPADLPVTRSRQPKIIDRGPQPQPGGQKQNHVQKQNPGQKQKQEHRQKQEHPENIRPERFKRQ